MVKRNWCRERFFSLAGTAALLFTMLWAGAQTPGVRIGNYYVKAPNGIAFIKDDAAAIIIDPGGLLNAGTVAPDESYHHTLLPSGDGNFTEFEWARVADGVVACFQAHGTRKLVLSLEKNWPNFKSTFSATNDGVVAEANIAMGKVTWQLRTLPTPFSTDSISVTLSLGDKPVYLVAGFGHLSPFENVKNILDSVRKNYQQKRPQAKGPSGDIVEAMTDNVNNSRIYSSDNKMSPVIVSRSWGDPNFEPYFCWDSFFNGLMASIDNPETARETIRAILSGQSTEGLVPNFTHWMFQGSRSSDDRSQPPVGGMCVWKMHLRQPDLAFLAEVYPKLALWHSWWLKKRQHNQDGLLSWGSNYNGPEGPTQGALWETGWDDTPQFDGYPGVARQGEILNCYAVDLNALWAMDAEYLALIADALSRKNEAAAYRQQEKEMNERINKKLWNSELGIYCSRFFDDNDGTPGKFLTRLTPANFYPLICGAASQDKANLMIKRMTDTSQFWGDYILPTVSRQDPAFPGQRYWHGTIWGPVNYLVWLGLKRYATPVLQAEFAQKSVNLFMKNWREKGQCGENFLSTDGTVGGDPHYTWGALMCLVGIESVLDIDNITGQPKAGPGYNEPVTLKNIPVGGKLYESSVSYGQPKVSIQQQK